MKVKVNHKTEVWNDQNSFDQISWFSWPLENIFCQIRNLNVHKLDTSGEDFKDDLNDDTFNWNWVMVM